VKQVQNFSGKMHFPPGAVIFTYYLCTVRFYVHTAVLLKIKIFSCLDWSLITDILETASPSVSPVTVYHLTQHHVSNSWCLRFFHWFRVVHYKPANSFLCVQRIPCNMNEWKKNHCIWIEWEILFPQVPHGSLPFSVILSWNML